MRQKRILAFLLTLTMVLSMLPTNFVYAATIDASIFAGGKGTERDPYQIASFTQLDAFRISVNGGNNYKGVYVKLTDDIKMDSGTYSLDKKKSWIPIGLDYSPFCGIFDGNGHMIKNLYHSVCDDVTPGSYNNGGLFGCLDDGGVIKNLHVSGYVHGYSNVGGVVGHIVSDASKKPATVENCSFAGTVVGQFTHIGGIVGKSSANTYIKSCYNLATIRGEGDYRGPLGGIAGTNSGTIENCYNIGAVATQQAGITGTNESGGTVKNCYSVGYGITPNKGDTNVVNCYYQSNKELASSGVYISSYSDLASQSTFNNWDFGNVWLLETGDERPYLKYNKEMFGEKNPNLISTTQDLKDLSTCIRNGDNFAGQYFKMTNNIDCTNDRNATVIAPGQNQNEFAGTFDGAGYVIENNVKNASEYVGIFGKVTGVIKNLGVIGEINSDYYGGGIVGGLVDGGRVENCYFSGSVSGKSAGGIVGYIKNGTVSNCHSDAVIKGTNNRGGIYGAYGKNTSNNVNNSYYRKDKIDGNQTNTRGTAVTESDFSSGHVAWCLQNGQADKTKLVWGQNLINTAAVGEDSNKDKSPVFTSDIAKSVHRVTFMKESSNEPEAVRYVNNGKSLGSEFPVSSDLKLKHWSKTEAVDGEKFTSTSVVTSDMTVYAVWKDEVTFEVSGDKQTYSPDTEREITIKPLINNAETSVLSANDFTAKYYEVDENNNVLKSTEAVKAISAGKYLYVIGIKSNSVKNNYYINRVFEVTNTTLPDINNYDNIGYMYITSGAENAQKPIFFKDGTVNLKVGGKFKNTLTNENGTTATYESSNKAVATVDENGEVTAIGKGTATITATSVRENSTPVYASYTVNVGLATKTLTVDDVVVTAQSKVYDETKEVKLSAVLKDGVAYEGDNIKLDITGEFENADAGDNKTVSYKITGITGTGAENYVLGDGKIESTTTANITKASVTIICAAKTTRTFDGNPQEVDVSAMANGKVFDSLNYVVKYNNGKAPSAVGVYTITIELTDSADKNYTVIQPTATLEIKKATQDVFAIEGVPETVYYGDEFTLSADGATGDVTYTSSNSDILEITGENAVAKSTGKVTIAATSTKGGYNDRVTTKTIEVKKRVLTPKATATNRNYDGKNGVDVVISLENVANSEKITATAMGTMVNSDAGKGKIVYVNGITLSDYKNYTLSTQSLQTTVDIEPITITDFTISATNKKYDKSTAAIASVISIDDVLTADRGQVEIVGKAEFDSEDSGDRIVTFTASGLTGAKAQNYVLSKDEATAEAKIEPLKVDFVIGQTTFVYDKKDKEITASASDENGKIFKDFEIEYTDEDDKAATPQDVGAYKAIITLDDTTNYYTEQGEIKVTILEATQDSLVIVGLPGTIQYGDSFELEAVGGEKGGTYEWTADNENIAVTNAVSAKPTVTINGAVGDKVEISVKKTAENYEPISAKVVFVPTQKTVTFDISKLEQTYGNTSEVKVAPSDKNATYDVTYNGSGVLPTNAGAYTVKVTANGNYTGTQTATLNIKKATATGEISGVNKTYTYGTTVDKDTIIVTSTMNGVTPKITFAGTGIYVPQEEAPTKVGNYTVIAEFTDSNYETLTKTKDFVIEKATLTVKAKNAERNYGDSNPIFELEYDGFVYGEDINNLLAEPVATVKANASSPVTDEKTHYYITVSGGSAENYKFKYDNKGELVIKPTTDGTLYITGSSNTVRVNDVFTLHAFYGNNKVNAKWGLSADSATDVVDVGADGRITAKKAGTVTITATADKNYGEKTAEFILTVKQTGITLTPINLVKTYTGDRQDISFAENPDFTPVLSGEGKNIDITYTLISDPTVTEPIQVGTYSVAYTVKDGSYTGGGNATMYINKATVSAKAKDDSKTYGDEYTAFDIEIINNGGITNEAALTEVINSIKSAIAFASDGAAKTAAVKEGGYEIIPTLSRTETDNVKFSVDKGTLTVNKAPLTIKVKDVVREYGAENPTLEEEYTGFVNDETKDALTGELVLAYDESINAETTVGTYKEMTTASGLNADNYELTFEKGDVTITKIPVKASAGGARASFLTVNFDKSVEGVTFKVTDANGDVEITEVTASSDNMSYTLKGSFTVGTDYTVEITYTSDTKELTEGKTLTIKPSKSSSGGGGGGSSTPASYTVTFETNGGSKVDSVKVTKNNIVVKPTEPTKDGFVFDGWYSDKNFETAYDFDTKVTKSITLYAKWIEKQVDDKKDDNKDNDNKPSADEWKNPFIDVTEKDWFFESVKFANQNGLMGGMDNDEFAPNATLTRGMLVTVLYRAEGEPEVNKSIPFADVKADKYYANAVIWAEQNEIVNGVSETEFAPDENITREQIAVILYRYAKFKNAAPVGAWAIKLDYADKADISDYAAEGVMYCTLKGIMNGKGENMFKPKDYATRAEIATVLQRFVEGNK